MINHNQTPEEEARAAYFEELERLRVEIFVQEYTEQNDCSTREAFDLIKYDHFLES
jgi:N-acyl-L-homoserine lactone synthetase